MSTWSECPACGAIVGNAELHAASHARDVAESELVSGVTAPTFEDGEHWPVGLPVPVLPDADPINLATIRTRVETFRGAATTGIQACDTYIANPAPSQLDALKQVLTLTKIARGLLIATRALANFHTRHQED